MCTHSQLEVTPSWSCLFLLLAASDLSAPLFSLSKKKKKKTPTPCLLSLPFFLPLYLLWNSLGFKVHKAFSCGARTLRPQSLFLSVNTNRILSKNTQIGDAKISGVVDEFSIFICLKENRSKDISTTEHKTRRHIPFIDLDLVLIKRILASTI